MHQIDREGFGRLMIGMGELYRSQVSRMLIKLYWDVLEVYDWQDVLKAFEAHVKDPDTGQFMPKPADIIRVIDGNSQCQGLQAWTKVEQAIRLVGPYRSVVFDDPTIHAVLVEMGGWIKLCQTSQDELPFVAKEFQTRFKAYRYGLPSNYPHYLIGLNEHQNGLCGFNPEPPKLLGDETKAKAVLSHGGTENQLNSFQNIIAKLPQLQYRTAQEGI